MPNCPESPLILAKCHCPYQETCEESFVVHTAWCSSWKWSDK
jgi:hypothetical protein